MRHVRGRLTNPKLGGVFRINCGAFLGHPSSAHLNWWLRLFFHECRPNEKWMTRSSPTVSTLGWSNIYLRTKAIYMNLLDLQFSTYRVRSARGGWRCITFHNGGLQICRSKGADCAKNYCQLLALWMKAHATLQVFMSCHLPKQEGHRDKESPCKNATRVFEYSIFWKASEWSDFISPHYRAPVNMRRAPSFARLANSQLKYSFRHEKWLRKKSDCPVGG